MEVDVSLITIVNKKNVYEEFIANLGKQTNINYELIVIENYNNEYSSATVAYNEAAKKAKGQYFMFLHPDIRFENKYELSNIVSILSSIPSFSVVGVAGAIPDHKRNRKILSNIIHGIEREAAGEKIKNPTIVQTIDECLFIIRKDMFLKRKFKERLGWHLYSVEYCLDAIKNNENIFVIPANVWHLSNGNSLDYRYISILKNIINEYKNDFDYIYTTVKVWKTKGIIANIYLVYYFIKQWIKIKIFRL